MNNNTAIRDMLSDYRPDEKFLTYGARALTGAELLAVILRTGSPGESSVAMAQRLLYNESSGSEDLLKIFGYDIHELMKLKGIGKVKALQLKAVCELSRRIALTRAQIMPVLNDPAVIAEHYMEELRHRKKESLLLLLLNSACGLIREVFLSEGTVNATIFSPREIFLEALRYEAVNIILLHNHPSGHVEPSNADILATQLICKSGNMLGISLLDHIIIGDRDFCSLREKGLIHE